MYNMKLAAESMCPTCSQDNCDGCAINQAMLELDTIDELPYIEDLDFTPAEKDAA